uniref:Porin n=1 Tax=Roseihalotalea indica TaxID=2867963 RepID=A0AA49GJR8_9BACT|nr:hypothetical protein K4G66_21655 [Tunicatimonas sp. TK19036]
MKYFFPINRVFPLLLLLGWGFQSQAQDSSMIIHGTVEVDHISYFHEHPDSIIDARNQGTLQIDLERSVSDKTKVFASVEFREGFSDKQRNRIFPKEYYVDVTFSSVDLRIGKQIYSWGRADGINFTNNLTPLDFSDILDLDDEEFGILSASATYYYKNWSLQTVFVPVFVPSFLPHSKSVWTLPQVIPNPQFSENQVNAVYQPLPDIGPANDLSSAQYAARLDGQLGRIDLSASYYHGYGDIPEIQLQPVGFAQDTITLSAQNIYIPWDVVGLDFATTFGGLGFRGEGAYFITSGEAARLAQNENDYLQYSLGLDYLFSLGQSNSTLHLLTEYMQEIVPEQEKYPATSFNHLFQQTFLVRGEYAYRGLLTLSMQALYDFQTEGYYIQPEVAYQWVDGLTITARADILGGEEPSFFQQYTNNDRIQFKAQYQF